MRARLAGGSRERKREMEEGGEEGEVQREDPRICLRRRVPFRLTAGGKKSAAEPVPPVQERLKRAELEVIDEEEELQRLAGLQLRERLVRGLDLPQALSLLLSSPHPSPSSLLAPQAPSTLPPRTHSSAHHYPHMSHSTPLSSGCIRGPLTRSVSLRLPHSRATPHGSTAPLQSFGLVVTAAPVISRHHPPSHKQ